MKNKFKNNAEQKQEISDLIFTELIKRGFEVKENKRIWNIADSKLWYLSPKQSQGYLDITRTTEYQEDVVKKEESLLKEVLPKISQIIMGKSLNLLDLGCGDGIKAILVIKALSQHAQLRYCPIDISAFMVQTAATTIKNSGFPENVLEMKFNVSDFENLNNVTPLFRSESFDNHLLMLLGNTLGNFDVHSILHGIKQGMKSGDLLVIGNGIIEDNTDLSGILETYNNPKIKEWLSQVISGIGLNDSDVEFHTEFKNSCIEEYFRVKTDKVISALGQQIYFKKDDEILVAVSNKYTSEKLKEEIDYYFNDSQIILNKDNSYALVIAELK